MDRVMYRGGRSRVLIRRHTLSPRIKLAKTGIPTGAIPVSIDLTVSMMLVLQLTLGWCAIFTAY